MKQKLLLKKGVRLRSVIVGLAFASVQAVFAQPANDNCSGAITLTPGATCTTTTGNVSGATSSLTGCVGNANDDVWYKFTATTTNHTITVAGSSGFDAVVQLFDGGASPGTCNGTSLICRDNSGTGSTETIAYTSFTVGNVYFVRVYDYYTGTPSTTTFTICVTGVPAVDPCSAITPIAACATPQTASFSGSGHDSWPTNPCYTSPGQERIYSFTPPTSGSYSIQVTSTSGGYVDYLWKTGSCATSGWTCIDDVTSVGTYPIGNLTAGVPILILLDAEATTSRTHTFQITGCPMPGPCDAITALAACGAANSHTFPSGTGTMNPPTTSCGYSTPGHEKIYSYTAPTSGTYTLSVSSSSVGYVDYFFKAQSGGCGSTGWTCISDLNGGGSASVSLTAGTAYY
jgi:hypothetical protein